jgi:hypothetical protein
MGQDSRTDPGLARPLLPIQALERAPPADPCLTNAERPGEPQPDNARALI